MEQNLNKQPDIEKISNIQIDPTRDSNGVFEEFLLRKRKLGLQIEKGEADLEKAVKDRMENPATSDKAYDNFITKIKNEIEILKFKRDNLHNETTH